MKPKIILASGMMRSGSTWQYNLIRLSLEEAGFKVYGCWVEDYDPLRANQSDYVVIKMHSYLESWVEKSDFIFTTIRNAKELNRSLKRTGIGGKVKHHYRNHARWFAVADHISSYSHIKEHQTNEALLIVEVLGINYKSNQSLYNTIHRLNELEQPQEGSFESTYDPITLLHPKHIENA